MKLEQLIEWQKKLKDWDESLKIELDEHEKPGPITGVISQFGVSIELSGITVEMLYTDIHSILKEIEYELSKHLAKEISVI